MHVRIVLVEPREVGNVGAAARAIKNFGFTDLWIAGAGEERTDDVSSWWAVGANDVVLSATRVGTLDEALADCHLTVATTAVRERNVLEQLTPHDVAELAAETLGDEHRLGPYTPKTNGKVERFIQTLLREWAYRFSYESSDERKQWLAPYLHFYNYHRAHSALAYNPPISRLVRNNVLRRNS